MTFRRPSCDPNRGSNSQWSQAMTLAVMRMRLLMSCRGISQGRSEGLV